MMPKHQPSLAQPAGEGQPRQPASQGRILVVIPTLHRGGAERVVSRLSHEWARQGYEVTVAVFDSREVAYPIAGPIVALDAPASNNKLVKVWRFTQRIMKLVKLIKEGKAPHSSHSSQPSHFTHLIGFMEYANFPLILAACLTGNLGRTRVSVRTSTQFMFGYQKPVMRLLYRLPYKVVAVSQAMKKELMGLGVPSGKLSVIFNPPPEHQALPSPFKKNSKITGKYILAVGRLVKKKGFDMLLTGYARLPSDSPPLVILGEEDKGGKGGGKANALVTQAKTLGISQRVHFIGAVKNPEAYYAHAECFVLSSRFEGMPNTILEAMQYGCPVVSFDCPTGPGEIIKHGVNGLLVANGDVAGLTRAMAKVLGDAKLRQRLGKAGRKRMAEFRLDDIAAQWLE
ncbi:MAG: glycosyltransferase family 4 protein [Proteobacteria bacterium]|nr:glycosyltransferase family 4 protein [Pseudomonadota bacterium]